MPDIPIKPPNKRIEELTTEITFEAFEKYKYIKNKQERDQWIIDYLGKKLAYSRALCEEYKKILDESSK